MADVKSHKSHRKHRRKISYSEYMLFWKIPIRFGMIFILELFFSLTPHILVKSDILSSYYRPMHVAALLGFWFLNWELAGINRRRTSKLSHYYICNLSAYALFLIVAFCAFLLNYHSSLYPKDHIYYPCFRLSYIIAMLPTKRINENLLPLSMGAFYGVTLASGMLEPAVAKLRHKLRRKRHSKRRQELKK